MAIEKCNEKEKKLFKAILGEMISLDYAEIKSIEIVKTAMGAISSFCDREGIKLEYLIKN